MSEYTNNIAAVLLAGGQSQRMQKDKRFLPFGSTNLLEHSLNRLKKQSSLVIVNSNTALPRIDSPRVADLQHGRAGPADGLLSTLYWLKNNHSHFSHLLSAPVDCPFLPTHFAQQLWQARDQNDVVLAASGGRHHYTCALWSVDLLPALQNFIESGERALKHFVSQQKNAVVEFPIVDIDPFFNINKPRDYHYALSHYQA